MRRHSAATLSFFVSMFVVLANQPAISGPNNWTFSGLRGAVTKLAIAPSSPNVLYAYLREANAVLKSTDGGRNWAQVLTGVEVGALGVHPSNSNIVFASAFLSLSQRSAVLRSKDGGTTWVELDLGPYADPGDFVAVLFHPANPDIIDFVRSDCTYRTVDGGTNWTPENCFG